MMGIKRTATSLTIIILLAGCHSATHHSNDADTTDAHHANDHGMRDPDTNARAADALMATEDLPTTLGGIDLAIGITNHNLQNAETTAFRGRRVIAVEGEPPHFGLDVEQGRLERTGRELDLGISGTGYFCVRIPGRADGFLAYTRNGNFFLNPNGELASNEGFLIQPTISVPRGATDMSVTEDGTVTCVKPGSATKSFIGTIKLFQFTHGDRLGQGDYELLFANHSSGPAVEVNHSEAAAATLFQNFLEASNVNVYRERQRLGVLKSMRAALLQIIDGN